MASPQQAQQALLTSMSHIAVDCDDRVAHEVAKRRALLASVGAWDTNPSVPFFVRLRPIVAAALVIAAPIPGLVTGYWAALIPAAVLVAATWLGIVKLAVFLVRAAACDALTLARRRHCCRCCCGCQRVVHMRDLASMRRIRTANEITQVRARSLW
jgi:hypothetical protein